jgi:DNA-binding Lrp family transcriptional regulator
MNGNEGESKDMSIDMETVDVDKYIDEDTGMPMAKVNLRYHTVYSNKQIKAFQRKLEGDRVAKKRGKNYVNCIDEPIRIATTKAIGNELGALFIILHYMQLGKGGLLIKRGKPATLADIANMIGKSERQTARVVNKLDKLGIVLKDGGNRDMKYIINEEYFIMGAFEGGWEGRGMFARLYQLHSRTSKLKKITMEDANILLRILPWFHYQKYYLCSNPYEPNPDEVHHLNESELAEIIGVHRNTLSARMANLVKAGYILKTIGIGKAYFFQVNPDIMSREVDPNSEDAKVLRQHFAELEKIDAKAELLKEYGLQ